MGCVYVRLEIDYARALRTRLRAVLIAMNWVPFDNEVASMMICEVKHEIDSI